MPGPGSERDPVRPVKRGRMVVMEHTAELLSPRRRTRQIHVGDVAVGGGAPVTVQSMTTTKTADVEGTLAQIYALAAAGADIVRCTCNERGGGRRAGPDRAPLAGADRRRHPLPPRDGAGRARGRASRGSGSIPATSARRPRSSWWPARPRTAACPSASASTPDRSHPDALQEVRRRDPRGPGRVGPQRAGLLRGGRLRRREDLGQGVRRSRS